MSDECFERDVHGEAIIANAMRLSSLISVCLRAARHAGRHERRPGDLAPEGDQIVRDAYGHSNPQQWGVLGQLVIRNDG